jgi:hypothetical protein
MKTTTQKTRRRSRRRRRIRKLVDDDNVARAPASEGLDGSARCGGWIVIIHH